MDADAVPSIPSSSSVAAMPPSCHVVRQRPSSANRSMSITAVASSNVATMTASGTVPPPGPAIQVPKVRPTKVISFNVGAVHFRINVSIFFIFLYIFLSLVFYFYIAIFYFLCAFIFYFYYCDFFHHEFGDLAIKSSVYIRKF